MTDEQLQGVEDASLDPEDGDDEIRHPIRYTISSYGADMPVDGVVERVKREDIFLPPFQRNFVWTKAQASRFIESLLLGLPVPGIFLFKEPETQKLMVVDGQQRLLTLQSFYKGVFGNESFRLVGVADEFKEKTYEDLAPAIQRCLNASILHATIFHQTEPGNDRSSVYSVFERLNTGGTPLSAQEIRACVSRGGLNDLLSEMASNSHWRNLFGTRSKRKKDEEIILRFFALFFRLEEYERPMKQFLNNFMNEYREPDEHRAREFREIFEKTVEAADTLLTSSALRPQHALNVSVADAVLVGLAHRVRAGPVSDRTSLKSAHKGLLTQLEKERLYSQGTTNKERVDRRIDLAREAYRDIP